MLIYIDPSQGSSGDGTIQNPYNSFTEVNALTGNQNGLRILIKCNTIARQEFAPGFAGLIGCYNYKVSSYGDGKLPIIKCSDVFAGAWTAETNLWYISDSNGHRAVWANGVLLAGVANKGDLTQNQSWYDTTNNRIYIILDGTDPNTVEIELQAIDRDKCLRVYQNSSQFEDTNVLIEQVDLVGGYDSLWMSNLRANVVVQDIIARETVQRDANQSGAGAGDGAIIYAVGAAAAVPVIFPEGLHICNNTFHSNQHNGLEVWGWGDHIIERNILRNNGNGCEYWGYMRGGRFSENVIENSGNRDATFNSLQNSLFVKGSAEGAFNGRNDGTEFTRNILSASQNDGLDIQAGRFEVSFNYIEGGRKSTSDHPVFFTNVAADNPPTEVYLHHNVIRSLDAGSRMMWASGTPPSSGMVILDPRTDYNVYWCDAEADHFSSITVQSGATNSTYSSLAAYKAGVSFDQNAQVIDPDRFLIDIEGGDYRMRRRAPQQVGPSAISVDLFIGNMYLLNGAWVSSGVIGAQRVRL